MSETKDMTESDNSVNRGEIAKGKPRGRPFPKGNKMGGRKAISPEVKAAYEAASPEALATLRSVMKAWNDSLDPKLASAAVASANSVLDRAHGKAPSAPEDNEALQSGNPFAEMSPEEMIAYLKARREARERR